MNMNKILLLLLLSGPAFTQDLDLTGYAAEISGGSISYHSPLPDVRQALIARARRDIGAIAWETAAVPAGNKAAWVQFTWLFGIDVNPEQNVYRLYAGDRELLQFRNPADNAQKTWTLNGAGGSTLRFAATMIDQHGDLMGFATLRLPAAWCTPGQGLRLRVEADDAGSNAWYMTFKKGVEESVSLKQQPVVLRENDRRYFMALLEIVSLEQGVAGSVQAESGRQSFRLNAGHNSIPIRFDAAPGARQVPVRIAVGRKPAQTIALALGEVPEWTVYMVQHSHTDIGYTRPQTEILPEHLRYIDTALDYCDQTDHYPDDAKFRWTCESSWAVREYLKSRPVTQIERLKKRIAEGRIEATGMFFNMSEMLDEVSLADQLQPLSEFRQQGIGVKTAMQNDVNGIGWALAEYFPDLGVRYLIMGEHGHRAIIPFALPTVFWWESPSGKRTLAFRAEHYMYGNFLGLHTGDLPSFGPKLLGYLSDLKARNYPWNRIALQSSGYFTDNSPPSTFMCDLTRSWNETYEWPKIRIATAQEFMAYMEANHGGSLPVHRVAWPDWWTDGFGSAARETAASRHTHSNLSTQEGLLAMARLLGAQLPGSVHSELREIKDALLFYDEHTFGAAESVSDPMAENTMVQWAQKSAYAWEALKRTGRLNEVSMGFLQPFLPRAEVPVIAVFNTLNWPRSGITEAYIDHQVLPPGRAFRIVDGTGAEMPAQLLRSREDGSYWAIYARDVPAFGFSTYRLELAPGTRPSEAPPAFQSVAENRYYRLALDSVGNIASLRDLELDIELADADNPWKMGQLVYERLSNRGQLEQFRLEHADRIAPEKMRVVSYSTGPVWNSLRLQGDLPGCADPRGVEVEIRLYNTEKRIEWIYSLHKLPVTDPEALYVAFPFALRDGRLQFEAQGGMIRPGDDQLEGTASDWNTVQSVVMAADGRAAVHWSSQEIPLVQLGAINLGNFSYRANPEKPHIYSWVLNNYWTTNFRASQEGALRWTYQLSSGSDRSLSAATRFGWTSRVPMAVRVLPGSGEASAMVRRSALQTGPPNLLLVGSSPAADGASVILQLRELDGRATEMPLSGLVPGLEAEAFQVDALGESPVRLAEKLTFSPYETKFIRLTIR
jgi:alpha-mannosidase